VQVGRLQEQQGEEQPALVAGDQPDQPVFGAGLVDGEGECGDADVGVEVFVIGVAVVAVVLAHPPVEADTDQQVGVEQPGQVVGVSGAEQLAVAGVMAHEGELGEDDRQVAGWAAQRSLAWAARPWPGVAPTRLDCPRARPGLTEPAPDRARVPP
jgi:hypothetical protein